MSEQTEPWRVVKRDDYTQRQTNIGVLIDGHVYELGDVNNERNRINANLIAAAPELLAALEAAREFIIDGMAMGFVGMPEDEDVMEVIEKAISKAKGGSK